MLIEEINNKGDYDIQFFDKQISKYEFYDIYSYEKYKYILSDKLKYLPDACINEGGMNAVEFKEEGIYFYASLPMQLKIDSDNIKNNTNKEYFVIFEILRNKEINTNFGLTTYLGNI